MTTVDLIDIYEAAEASVRHMEKNAPACTACKYVYLTWSNEIHFTIYLKPGIVIPIQMPAHEVNPLSVRREFERALIEKLLGDEEQCREDLW